jgi:hypothetical protein
LATINMINAYGSRLLWIPPAPPHAPPPFVDTSGDNDLTPQDVLLVINYINRYGSGPIPTAGTMGGAGGAAGVAGVAESEGEAWSDSTIPVSRLPSVTSVDAPRESSPRSDVFPWAGASAGRRMWHAEQPASGHAAGWGERSGKELPFSSVDAVHTDEGSEDTLRGESLTNWREVEDALHDLMEDPSNIAHVSHGPCLLRKKELGVLTAR